MKGKNKYVYFKYRTPNYEACAQALASEEISIKKFDKFVEKGMKVSPESMRRQIQI